MGLFGIGSRRDENVPTRQNLTDIARGLAHAALAVDEVQDQQFIRLMARYFEKGTDGVLRPKLVRIEVGDKTVDTPLISLVNPDGLALSKIEVELSVRLKAADVKQVQHAATDDVTRSSFAIELAPRSKDKASRNNDILDIRMTFDAVKPPEGVARIVEQFDNMLSNMGG